MKLSTHKVVTLFTAILISAFGSHLSARDLQAQDLGQGYKCAEVSILDKKNKVVKIKDAKKAIQKKIKTA